MSLAAKVRLYVALVAATSIAAMALAAQYPAVEPGYWAFGAFLLTACILDQAAVQLRVDSHGSLSFIIHLAAGILFGGFWGGLVAGLSTAISLLFRGTAPVKIVFNVAQRALSVSAAWMVYAVVLHGSIPPSYLAIGLKPAEAIQRDLFLSLVYAAAYIVVNQSAVSLAVALNTSRKFREVWHVNVRGVLGYDLGASVLAVVLAVLYAKFERAGYGPLGLLATVLPLVVVRHVYGLYHQLQDSGQELLQVMVKAIEARDPYTSGHSLRVSKLSHTIAVELGLSARELEQVETAALLHDVGKIHEEFAPLLRKESRLDAAETALMQTHSAKSADLVGIISKFRGVIQESVRHHHERWDGGGYPEGLSGSSIPLGSRIILISDTIDAMTTDRPYRKRLPVESVIAELTRCKGTQFDPEIIDVVISSVAVRRVLADAHAPVEDSVIGRSRKVTWPAAKLWPAKRTYS